MSGPFFEYIYRTVFKFIVCEWVVRRDEYLGDGNSGGVIFKLSNLPLLLGGELPSR